MPLTLHTLSGPPYAWRVWIALEHEGIPHTLRTLSYDAGDFASPAFAAPSFSPTSRSNASRIHR